MGHMNYPNRRRLWKVLDTQETIYDDGMITVSHHTGLKDVH